MDGDFIGDLSLRRPYSSLRGAIHPPSANFKVCSFSIVKIELFKKNEKGIVLQRFELWNCMTICGSLHQSKNRSRIEKLRTFL